MGNSLDFLVTGIRVSKNYVGAAELILMMIVGHFICAKQLPSGLDMHLKPCLSPKQAFGTESVGPETI